MANIGVLGPEAAQDAWLTDAQEVGRLLAGAGHVVFCGGLGGVMARATRGARDAGGLTVGLLPGHHPAAGNEYLSVRVPTGLGQARNALLVNSCAGFIAVGGSWGTLSEIALALRGNKPVAWLHGWQVEGLGASPSGLERMSAPADAVQALGRRLEAAVVRNA